MPSFNLASVDRTLTHADAKKNIPFPFNVPAGSTRLTIRVRFAPWVVDGFKNLIPLTLFDPDGFRGAGHRHGDAHEVVINAHRASAGYRAGAIQPGEWTLFLDTHMVMPGEPCRVHIEISVSDEPVTDRPQVWPQGHTAPRGRGWYRGDLHAHTIHSDASWDVPDLVAWARSNHLDFVTLSDHNAVSGLTRMDAARADRLLTMGGIELTTFWGHALVLGVREWVDWRVRLGERSMPQIAAEAMRRGGTFIIAHPMSIGDPICTGCQWRYEEMMPGNARLVEVWNESWLSESDNNEEAFKLAIAWMNQGYRIAMTSGTDNHGRSHDPRPYGFNVVYADELSEQAILSAIRSGHSYLSSGPTLELNAGAGDRHAMMGDVINLLPDAAIQISASWGNVPAGAELGLVVDGQTQETRPVQERGAHSWDFDRGRSNWCLLTLRDQGGAMLALTNPIYFDGRM